MQGGGGSTGWQRVGTEWGQRGVCVFKGSLALNLFHMTPTHMASVWTLSLFLSVFPSPGPCGPGEEVGEGGVEVDISRPQQELCGDRGQAVSHTRTLVAPLITRRGLHSRSSSLAFYLFAAPHEQRGCQGTGSICPTEILNDYTGGADQRYKDTARDVQTEI